MRRIEDYGLKINWEEYLELSIYLKALINLKLEATVDLMEETVDSMEIEVMEMMNL